MKMKRLIGLIIVFVLLLGCFEGAGFASSNVDNVIDENVIASMKFLKYLNIIPDYQEFNVDLEKKVTRGDLATYIYNVFGDSVAVEAKTYYYDVPKTHWAHDAVSYLTKTKN